MSALAVGRIHLYLAEAIRPFVIIDRRRKCQLRTGRYPGMGEGGAGAVAPSQGSAGDALAYPDMIYNQNGVYFENDVLQEYRFPLEVRNNR